MEEEKKEGSRVFFEMLLEGKQEEYWAIRREKEAKNNQ